MDDFVIRKAVRDDMKQIIQMIIDLAVFEGFPNGVEITAKDLERDGFDSNPPYFICIVAERTKSKEIVGYSLCNFAYSSWSARAMYIEDFYVKPELRGRKLGHRLFKETCKVAVENDCNRIDWHTLVDNETAIKFYESRGAFDICKKEARTCYRIERNEMDDVVNSTD